MNINNAAQLIKLGIICSQFPEMHETFVIRELKALHEAGIPLTIYSMKRCRDKIRHPEAALLKDHTVEIPWDSPSTWGRAMRQWIRQPIKGLTALAWVIQVECGAKSVGVWFQSLAIAAQMKKDGVTHVHAHWATLPTTAAVVCSKVLNLRFSFTAHAWDIYVKNPSLKEKVRLAEKVITCTDYNRRYLSELVPEAAGRIELNYHGVDLEKFKEAAGGGRQEVGGRKQEAGSRKQEKAPLFLTVGRFVEQKGYPDLLEAYQKLHTAGIPFRAVIVGEGPQKKRLASKIKDAGLDRHVTLKASMPASELKRLYSEAYAFVLPSVIARNNDRDGIPNVILEAMAAGLPIVSTTVSGIPEAVETQKNGLLVEPHSPEELFKALRDLLEKPEWANAMRLESRKAAEQKFDDRKLLSELAEKMRRGSDTEITRPARILYLIDKLSVGGSQTNLLQIVKNLDRRRFIPYVMAIVSGGELTAGFQQAGVEPKILGVKKAYDLSGLKALFQIKKFIQDEKIDIVQTHFLHADILGILAGRKAGVKKILVARRDEGFWRNGRQLAVNRFFNRFADRVLCNSQAVARAVAEKEGVLPSQIDVIYNGVEIPSINERRGAIHRAQSSGVINAAPTGNRLDLQSPVIIVGVVANMRHAIKGHTFLLEAMAEVLAKAPQVKLVLAGDGPLRPDLEAYAAKLGIAHAVIFLGSRPDIAAVVKDFDIACLPSLTEGFSNSLLEYMTYGKPVVATAVGGNPEAVTHETGFLVPPRDAGALAEKLLLLIEDEKLRASMGRAGRQRVEERFSVRAMVAGYERYYENLLGIGDTAKGRHGEIISPDLRVTLSPRRICHLIWALEPGGAERQVVTIAKWQQQNGFQPRVVCLTRKGALAAELEERGIPVDLIEKKAGADFSIIGKLAQFFKDESVDLVHTHVPTANLWGRLAAKKAGCPVIVSEHSDLAATDFKFKWINRFLTRDTAGYLVVSQHIKDLMAKNGIPEEKIRVIRNGIPIEKNSNPEIRNSKQIQNSKAENKSNLSDFEIQISDFKKIGPLIGTVGRLEERKDQSTFLKACALIQKEIPSARFMIIGDGPLRAALEKEAEGLGIRDAVIFTGVRQDIPALLAALDIFVLSSLTEGISISLLEAMASGKPCVATRVGGNPEVITDRVTGRLVSARQPAEMADTLCELLRNPGPTAEMAGAGKSRVISHFSQETMMQGIRKVYEIEFKNSIK